MSDTSLFAATILAFAVFITAHVSIVYGLIARTPRWRALVALIAPPFAVYWAFRERMRLRMAFSIGSVAVYAVAMLIQRA